MYVHVYVSSAESQKGVFLIYILIDNKDALLLLMFYCIYSFFIKN